MHSGRISFFPVDHAHARGESRASVPDFVRELARQLGHEHATLTSSGRVAMTILFQHLGLVRENEVFVTTTFDYPNVSSCVTCTIFNFAKPARVLTRDTRAIFVIHEFGVPHPETPQLKREAERRGIPLIEDCAHTIDSHAEAGWSVGHFGDWSIVSFPKVFATSAGGMLVGPAVPLAGGSDDAALVATTAERAAADWPDWTEHAHRRRAAFMGLAARFARIGLQPLYAVSDRITPWFFPVKVSRPEALLRSVRDQQIDCGRWHGSDVLVFPCHQFLTDSHLDRIAQAASCFEEGS